jgi:hypothetical protein
MPRIPHLGVPLSTTAADHDQPYRLGSRPTAKAPFPVAERQFARLLILRSPDCGGLRDGAHYGLSMAFFATLRAVRICVYRIA